MSECKTKADLYREYARVLEMCAAAEFEGESWKCIKFNGEVTSRELYFDSDITKYSFALAIVEGKPVFEGDVLFELSGAFIGKEYIMPTVDRIKNCYVQDWAETLSWTPPKKRTFMLNGEELPLPDGKEHLSYGVYVGKNNPFKGTNNYFDGKTHYWKDSADRARVVEAINKLLGGNP